MQETIKLSGDNVIINNPMTIGPLGKGHYALQTYTEDTWSKEKVKASAKSQLTPFGAQNASQGFYEKAYDKIFQNYYTDDFFFTIGKGQLGELNRQLVRKVNIVVPVYDDSCFDYCGADKNAHTRCKKTKCQPLCK